LHGYSAVRAVAIIPSVGLLIGSALGLVLPESRLTNFAALAVCAATAFWAWRACLSWMVALAVAGGFCAGGILLAADAWRDAWRPPLRVAFETLARERRINPALRYRPLAEEDAVQVTLTGVLRADASTGPNGVSLSVEVASVSAPERSGPDWRGSDLPGRLSADLLLGARGRAPSGSGPTGRGHDVLVEGGVLLTVVGALAADRIDQWRAGRTVRTTAQLRRPTRYLNPGVPDQERALARRGTTLVGTVKSGALVEVVQPGGWASEAAAAGRSCARRAIAANVGRWSGQSAAVIAAIVIGDRTGLDSEVERRLQEAGTYHVIAISGGNIAILTGLVLAAFRLAGLLGRGAMIASIAGLLGYFYLVGGGASVSRATLMAVVYLAGRVIDLRGPAVNVLALVAAVLAAAEPLAVLDPAFLLTFGATTAIVVALPVLPIKGLPGPGARAIASLLAASLAAEAALMPIGALHFSRVTFAGLALNFAAIPLMAVAQIAGMAVIPAAWIWPALAPALGWTAHLAAEGLIRSANLVELAPGVTWRVAPPHWLAVAAYYAGLAAAWSLWRRADATGSAEPQNVRRIRHLSGALAAGAAFWIALNPLALAAAGGDGRLHVTFIDVGQGDAALVRLPRGATLLVDAGGLPGASSFDIGDRVVAPVLRNADVRRIDSHVLTHGDADHIGGAPSILHEFRPRDIWEGIPVPPLEPLRAFRAAAGALGARWVNVQRHDRLVVDDVEVAVRHPRIADWERQDVRNDDSIVLELLWRDVSIVLTGDIGREVEQEIASSFTPARLRVVKVPHHGSRSSSSWEFVRALAPRVAVISAGRSNAFGHPAPDVVERYQRIGAELFRTDREGAVMLETDGYSIDIRTFMGRKLTVE
jgi:competence protein ComEC